jgi:hypothetical protein
MLMPAVRIGEGMVNFDRAYQEYVSTMKYLENTRFRGQQETIFDALASPEADFTTGAEGQQAAEIIQNYR